MAVDTGRIGCSALDMLLQGAGPRPARSPALSLVCEEVVMPMSLIVGTHYLGQTSWWLNAENHRVGREGRSIQRLTPARPPTISRNVRPQRNSKSMMRRMAGGAGVPDTPDSRWLYRPPALPPDRMPDAQPRACAPGPRHPVDPRPRSAEILMRAGTKPSAQRPLT
jgi:hypothetical protein